MKIDKEINDNLQNVKADKKTTPINISKNKVQIDGDLECTGESLIKLPSDLSIPNLTSNTITCPDIQATDIDFADSGTSQKITRISDNQIDVDTQILVVDNSAASGQARLEVFSGTGEDTFIVFREGVGSQNYIGTDAGDDKLKLGQGTTVGTSTYLELNATENVNNNPIKIVEQASATTDTAGQGQLWVKNDTPNNLYFTNDAGNDVQITNGSSLAGGGGGGSSTTEFRHLINAGFNYSSSAGTRVYVPLNGYIVELAFAGTTEFNTFVAPFDGSLSQVVFRSEEACGSTTVGFHKSSTGVEFPNPTPSASVTVDMTADDTPFKFAFTSGNTFSAGDVIAVSFDPTNDANDTIFCAEFILDSSAGL